MKSYTDLEQSRKLVEILSLDSADMYYSWIGTAYLLHAESYNEIIAWRKEYAKTHNNPSFCTSIIPCWSLAALLKILAKIANKIDDDGSINLSSFMGQWSVNMFDCPIEATDNYDNPIDACVTMIEKLNELKML